MEPPIGFERPAIEAMAEPKKRKFSTAWASSALTEEIALPTLRTSSSASSLRLATIASASAWRRRERSFGGVFAQGPSSATRATSTARSTSASEAVATVARGRPVAGSVRSRVSAASTDSPPIQRPYSWVAVATPGRYRLWCRMADVPIQAARIPDRDRLLSELQKAGLDARPVREVEIEVRAGETDDVYARVEGMIISLGAPFVPVKHEGVIYVRPPLS